MRFIVRMLNYFEHFAESYPTLAGILFLTLVFLAGYQDFEEGRPSGRTWYWWTFGLLGFVGYLGVALRAGFVWPVAILTVCLIVAGFLVWRHLRRRSLSNRRPGGGCRP